MKKKTKSTECTKGNHDLQMIEGRPLYAIYACKRPGCSYKKRVDWNKN